MQVYEGNLYVIWLKIENFKPSVYKMLLVYVT